MVFAVAFDGNEPLGTALLDLDADSWSPELRNMYVYPSARRRGAGRALSTYLEDVARKAGHTAVYLAVDPNNEKAIPLYVSLEYHPTGEHLFVEDPEVPQVEGTGTQRSLRDLQEVPDRSLKLRLHARRAGAYSWTMRGGQPTREGER